MQARQKAHTPIVPVFSLNLLPPFMAPNIGRVFFDFCSELLSNQDRSKYQLQSDTFLKITFRLKTTASSDPGSKEGICAGLVSSTSLRSLWASFRKSAMCTWSFLRSTASIATSLFTAVMKASSESSVDDVKDSDRSEKLQTGPFKVCRSVNRWSQLTSFSSTELFLSLCQLLLHLFQFGHLQKNNQQLRTRTENRFFL